MNSAIKVVQSENKRAKQLMTVYLFLFFGAFRGLASHFSHSPNHPIYIYSLFNFESEEKVVKRLFLVVELALLSCVWIKVISFELLIHMYAHRINNCLQLLIKYTRHETGKTDNWIQAYKFMTESVELVNCNWKWGLFFANGILLCYVVTAFYSSIAFISSAQKGLQFAFLVFGCGGLFHIFVIFKCLGNVHAKSVVLLKGLTLNGFTLNIKSELSSLRPLQFQNGPFFGSQRRTILLLLSIVITNVFNCLILY